MFKIVFKYKDEYTHGKWAKQEAVCQSVEQCIDWYGLELGDCDYEIISVKEVEPREGDEAYE